MSADFLVTRESRFEKEISMIETRIFTLEIDGKPTVCFTASSLSDAIEICSLDLLREDLGSLACNGVPLCSSEAELTARAARADEIEAFRNATRLTPPSDELTFAFLVQLDAAIVEIATVDDSLKRQP